MLDGLQPQKRETTLASGSISLEDEAQLLTEEDKRQHQEAVHAPWEGSPGDQKPLRFLPFVLTLVLVAIASAVGLLLFATLPEADTPPNAGGDLDEALGDEPNLPALAGLAIHAFFHAADTDDILDLVRDREQVEPRLRAYYANHPRVPEKEIRAIAVMDKTIMFETASRLMLVAKITFTDLSQKSAALEWNGEWMMFDWEQWVHYQPMPFEDFATGVALPEGEEPEFRVAAREPSLQPTSTHFDTKDFRCLMLRDSEVSGDEFPAYVRRGTHAASMLAERLQDGEKAVILRLRRVAPAAGGPVEIEIGEWIVNGWCRPMS